MPVLVTFDKSVGSRRTRAAPTIRNHSRETWRTIDADGLEEGAVNSLSLRFMWWCSLNLLRSGISRAIALFGRDYFVWWRDFELSFLISDPAVDYF